MPPKQYKPRRKTTQKKASYRAPTKTSLVRLIKSVSSKQAETKMCTYNASLTIYHNLSTRYGGNLLGTAQGITDSIGAFNRIGDTINLIGMKFLMQFRQPADRPNVNWKVWILKIKGNPTLPLSVPVKSVTGNLQLDPIDTEKCTVVKQLTFKNPDNYWEGTAGTSKETCFFKKLYIPFKNQKYVYSGDNADTGRDYQLCMFVTAYDTTGSLITDNIGSFLCHNQLYFKDP